MPPATTRPAVSASTATRPRRVDFQPGIRIDWSSLAVEVDATVILRHGLIELLACSPRTREHESILRIEARPLFLYQALGLIGLTPGHPLRYDPKTERTQAATGDPVEIHVRYPTRDGLRTEPLERWAREKGRAEPLARLPWVFAGSEIVENGGMTADAEGTVVAVVDFPSSLIALAERHSDRNEELWLDPNTEAIPPVGTKCTLLFRLGAIEVTLDATGRTRLAGRRMTMAAAVSTLEIVLRRHPHQRVCLVLDPRSPAQEQQQLRSLLERIASNDDEVTVEHRAVSTSPE